MFTRSPALALARLRCDAWRAINLLVGSVADPFRISETKRTVDKVALLSQDKGCAIWLQEQELKDSGLKQGGVLTPASALGMVLAKRLQNAGVSFAVQ